MSRAIEHVTIGSEDDGRLVLGNAQAARVFSIDNNWTRIRLGLRYSFDDTGASISGTPRFWTGLLSNPSVVSSELTNGPLNVATSHFVGMRSSSLSWGRFAGGGSPRYGFDTTSSVAHQLVKRVGSTDTTGANINELITADQLNVRAIRLIEITKGSPNFTLQTARSHGTVNGSTALVDKSYATLIAAMEISDLSGAATTIGGAISNSPGAPQPLAVDESADGPLNALCVAWDRTVADIHISDFVYALFP